MAKKDFNFRTFTSFILIWGFLTLIISGAVLYVAPPGRVANWTRWQLIVLSKEQWQAVHTLTAILFLVGGLFHLLKFNLKPLLTYLRRKTESGLRFRYEMLASTVLFLLIIAGTILQQPPFDTVMAAGESIRQSWEDPASSAPIPHMEEMTLQEFAGNLQMKPEALLQRLQTLGISPAGPEETLKQLAFRHQRSPEQIYAAVRSAKHLQDAAGSPGSGRGQGFKTLAQLAGENGLSVEVAVQCLGTNGIEARGDDLMRAIAERSGRKPYELIEILQARAGK